MGKIKHFLTESENGRKALLISGILLFGIVAFLSGRLSKSDKCPGIGIEYPEWPSTGPEEGIGPKIDYGVQGKASAINAAEALQNASKGNYFASKRGKKYYSAGCTAGKSIKLENRIYFYTENQAKSAGYEMSDSCR